MVNKKECEHELYATEEHWTSEEEVEVVMECSLCQAKFKGVIKRK